MKGPNRSRGRRVRMGVIGTGYLGEVRAKRLSEIPGVEIASIADISKSRAREVGTALGVPYYTDFRKVLEGGVEAVVISTPCSNHFSTGIEAVKRGVHALIEKPLCETIEEGRELVEEAEERGVILQVGFLERFNPSFILSSSYLNNPSFIEVHRIGPFRERGLDVDVVLDLMIHDLDIILSVVDSAIDRIDAKGVPVLSESVDIANVRLAFRNGCVANLTASRISLTSQRKIRFFQKDRYISIDTKGNKYSIYERRPDRKGKGYAIVELKKGNENEALRALEGQDPMLLELKAFLDSIRKGLPEQGVVSGREALHSLEIALDISRRLKEGNNG